MLGDAWKCNTFHLLEPCFFSEQGEKWKIENIRACLQESSQILDWELVLRLLRQDTPDSESESAEALPQSSSVSVWEGQGGTADTPWTLQNSPPGVKAMRVGQFVPGARGELSWWWFHLGRSPAVVSTQWGALCTHQKGCGDTEGTAMKACSYPGAAGSDKAWHEWHGSRNNSIARYGRVDDLLSCWQSFRRK